LLEQLLYRQSGTAGPFFLLLVQLFEADRQRAFRHIDSVPNLPQVQRILFVPRLIARLIGCIRICLFARSASSMPVRA
jgi:hypothetical protein